MEVPFKYIVLCIVKILNERKMPLIINKTTLAHYITVVVGNLYFAPIEKQELGNNFDFQYELDDLLSKYFECFEITDNEIVFDDDYIMKLDKFIKDEINEFGKEYIQYYDEAIECDTALLDILGIKVNKDLYNFLLDIEKDIEECYDDLYALESDIFGIPRSKKEICDKLKKLYMKKVIMLINSKNLLSELEFSDVKNYSGNVVSKIIDEDDVKLLCESDAFNSSDIVCDTFLNAIFTNNDLYICNLNETFINESKDVDVNEKYNKIKFYITLLDLIDKEINNSFGMLKDELIKVKYRLMNVLDSTYSTFIFTGNCNDFNNEYIENYDFIGEAVYYFINELLMYDDEKYRNSECNTQNIMVYLDNIVKKLLIETYYKLTKEDMVVDEIKGNKLYGINTISSGFLKNIVEGRKVKIKEV